jgi:molybdenum cofactor biosynthesis protein B
MAPHRTHRAHQGVVPAADVPCGILTVSDTRTPEDDTSGQLIRGLLEAAGHPIVSYAIVRDEPVAIRTAVLQAAEDPRVRALIVSGGTGITARDVTVESVAELWTRELRGFGETFRALSFSEIGPTALLSRATAGVVGSTFVALLPGSSAGCRLAVERLVLPLLGHVAALLASRP